MIRAIRGAITAENSEDGIIRAARELLGEILARNGLEIGRVVSVVFSCTRDLDAAYPARAAREMGITQASLMCLQEMHVADSLPKCIRVQVLAEMDMAQCDVRHVYLGGARALRPDLAD